jgi:ribosomal protein S18 acetylase RimI-like enzyme
MDVVFGVEGLDWPALEELFRLAKLEGRDGDRLRVAFENSQIVCRTYCGSRLIGIGRAITDYAYHACIYDVAVHPECQRRGVGTIIMRHLLDRLPVWRVILVASEDVQAFYTRLGFAKYEDVMAKVDWTCIER